MIDSRKSVLKPNIKVGDVFVDTNTHTILKVINIRLNKSWSRHCVDLEAPLTGEKRGLWLFLLTDNRRYHKL